VIDGAGADAVDVGLWIAESSARSSRRRGSKSPGKYVLWRSLGICRSMVPTPVSHSRSR
jgi:hypothetical protein